MHRLRSAAIALLIVAVCPAGATAASSPSLARIYTTILSEYTYWGTVPACQFTSAQLNAVLKSIDLYQQAYSSDFPNAIQAALAIRASGDCGKSGPRLSAGASTGGPLNLGPPTASTDANLPAPLLILAALVGAIVLLAGAAAVIRSRGWDPRWGAAARQSLGEAGYRIDGAWQDAADRLRRRDR